MARMVLVHGAFGGSWCWETVIPPLRSAGHDVWAIDLPGGGRDRTPADQVSLRTCAERICHVLGEGPPAMLVGQSMGGIAITQAAAWMPHDVTVLAYVSAFIPRDGQSLMDLFGAPEAAEDQVQANVVVDGDPPLATLPVLKAPRILFNCAHFEEASRAAKRLRPQPVKPWTQRFRADQERYEEFVKLPRAYVSCLQDHAIPLAMQRRMYSAANCDPVIEIDTDHSPWLSRPQELVAALEEIADKLG